MINNQQQIPFVLVQDLGPQYITNKSKSKVRMCLYKCHCGKEFKAMYQNVRRGLTKSCGCTKYSLITKHGLSKSRIYGIWENMKARVNNKASESFLDYGGRGIKIYETWNDFIPFYEWAMNNGYDDKLSIDRIDVDGNYEPSNCRFTNDNVQAQNTRQIQKNNTSGYRGVIFHKKSNKWMAQIDANGKHTYLGIFLEKIDAAKAYDKYVIENNLQHSINGVVI